MAFPDWIWGSKTAEIPFVRQSREYDLLPGLVFMWLFLSQAVNIKIFLAPYVYDSVTCVRYK